MVDVMSFKRSMPGGKRRIPVVIDTDSGHDDVAAIMLALRSDLLDVRAITTVAGNSTIENTTRNARYTLNLLGNGDVPVYSGADKPLFRELKQAKVHGPSGLAGIDPTNDPALNGLAVKKLLEIVGSGEGITLVTLGPLTNVARAIMEDRSAMMKTKQIVMMGGAIHAHGNQGRTGEFNIYVDPEAADIVLQFPIRKVMVPLDPCNGITVTLKEFEKVADGRLRNALIRMMTPFIENLNSLGMRVDGALLYDALAMYYLINPEAYKLKSYDVKVETKGELTRGMTVPELRPFARAEPNVEVAEEIDAHAFRRDLISMLSRKRSGSLQNENERLE